MRPRACCADTCEVGDVDAQGSDPAADVGLIATHLADAQVTHDIHDAGGSGYGLTQSALSVPDPMRGKVRDVYARFCHFLT